MFFRVCHLSCKNSDTLFANISRYYARTSANTFKTKKRAIDNEEETQKPEKKRIPIITCKRSSYNFYKGDTYSKKNPVLATCGWRHRKSRGDHFFIHPYNIDNDKETDEQDDVKTFKDLSVDPSLCSNLKNLNITTPLEVQKLAIPKIFQGCNTLIAAETGCGKTLAYILPLITQILRWKGMVQRGVNCPLGLIVTPSRELAVQIALEIIKLSSNLDVKTKIITGGRTKKMIRNPPVGNVDILVCSFGVISKLTTVGIYKRQFIRFVVLDEADALLHEMFQEKLKIFMNKLSIGYNQEMWQNAFPKVAQLVLASATIPFRLKHFLNDIVNLGSLEHVTTKKLHQILILQKFVRLGVSQKPAELLKYVKRKVANNQRVIVFSNSNKTCNWIATFLQECGVKTTNLGGDLPLRVRTGKYGEFLNGKTMVLSTTNAGCRGLDTVMINHILNYDFPLDTPTYIHRCGRTGRVGTTGNCRVTNFISRPGEIAVVKKIEIAIRKMKPIPIFNLLESDMEKEEELQEVNDPIKEIIENIDNVEDIPY